MLGDILEGLAMGFAKKLASEIETAHGLEGVWNPKTEELARSAFKEAIGNSGINGLDLGGLGFLSGIRRKPIEVVSKDTTSVPTTPAIEAPVKTPPTGSNGRRLRY